MESKTFKIKGMTDNHCKDKIETHLLRLKNVTHVDVDIAKNQIVVKADKVYDEFVEKVINGLGYSFIGEVN